ncbi:MAG: hypothetical protein AAF960_25560 [Bacteroidota bacterium]
MVGKAALVTKTVAEGLRTFHQGDTANITKKATPNNRSGNTKQMAN